MTYLITEPCIGVKDRGCVEVDIPPQWRDYIRKNAEHFERYPNAQVARGKEWKPPAPGD